MNANNKITKICKNGHGKSIYPSDSVVPIITPYQLSYGTGEKYSFDQFINDSDRYLEHDNYEDDLSRLEEEMHDDILCEDFLNTPNVPIHPLDVCGKMLGFNLHQKKCSICSIGKICNDAPVRCDIRVCKYDHTVY